MENEQFAELADESINVLTEIAQTAADKLHSAGSSDFDSFASGNTLTAAKAYQNLSTIKSGERLLLDKLCSEPAIMRVVLEDDDKELHVVYIARTSAITLPSKTKFASYRSPIGRSAEVPPGEFLNLVVEKQEKRYWIVEKTSYRPVNQPDGWDSDRTIYRHYNKPTVTVKSLRDFVDALPKDYSDELEALLNASNDRDFIVTGISHQVRTAMGLRDQPILDQFQGNIFRLPLDSKLIILGPPGTGKTTTLIKRIGLKLDKENLDADERDLVESSSNSNQHSSSWLMFTPSDLLKHYLKEAFSREQVPASDSHIRTWQTYRNDVARNTLGILKTANGGRFTLKAHEQFLTDSTLSEPISWFSAFESYHEARLRAQLQAGLNILTEAVSEEDVQLAGWLQTLEKVLKDSALVDIYRRLDADEALIKQFYSAAKAVADKSIKNERNLVFNKDKIVFDRLAVFLTTLEQDIEPDLDEVFDSEEQEESTTTNVTDIKVAVKAYEAAVRVLSRAAYLKQKLPKLSKTSKIAEFLQGQLPSAEVLQTIGRYNSLLNGLRRFLNSHKRFVQDIAASYQEFRKDQGVSEQYYQAKPAQATQLSAMELDALILLMLKNTRFLLGQTFVKRAKNESKFDYLINIAELFRNQIMVDEATDFSVLELACMANLTTLEFQSFFACGDFNQRITSTGIKRQQELSWAVPIINFETVNAVYRQSKTLNAFAKELLKVQGGDTRALGEVPEESIHEGVKPVLYEFADDDSSAEWIAKRIKEIEHLVKQLPTIAVLVNSEGEVKPMAERLNNLLEELNLNAVACEDGRALGEGTEVRVFDIKHIKGLEFEAVFFVGIDKLAVQQPMLFDRYLYVGATRAATYLGLICETTLPAKLETLRGEFNANWTHV